LNKEINNYMNSKIKMIILYFNKELKYSVIIPFNVLLIASYGGTFNMEDFLKSDYLNQAV